MPTVSTDPVLEAIARKLLGIETVPFAEKEKMIKRAAKAAREAARIEAETEEKIVQASGFGVANTPKTQADYMLVAVTDKGRVLMMDGYDGKWGDVSPQNVLSTQAANPQR